VYDVAGSALFAHNNFILLLARLSTTYPQHTHTLTQSLTRSLAPAQVRLLIDAEQTWFQPAIDNFTLQLMQKYNSFDKTDVPIVFNTYQCYLKDATKRVKMDVRRAKKGEFHFAAKLVRGAYMVAENGRAEVSFIPSPLAL